MAGNVDVAMVSRSRTPNIRVANFPLMLFMPVPLAGKPHPSDLQIFRVSACLRPKTETKSTWLLSQIALRFSINLTGRPTGDMPEDRCGIPGTPRLLCFRLGFRSGLPG